MLLAVKGLPGSGKSTLARALSRALGWPLVDKDDIKDSLWSWGLTADPLAYDVMLNVVSRQLMQGLSVTCDSPLLQRTYANLQQAAASAGAQLAVIECQCRDERLWRERLHARAAEPVLGHRITEWDALCAYQRRHADAVYPISEPHLVADTAEPVGMLVTTAVRWLEQVGR